MQGSSIPKDSPPVCILEKMGNEKHAAYDIFKVVRGKSYLSMYLFYIV